jgi:hypothetical protein
VVDEHAGELVADRLVHERGGDRGVDAAGEPADHPLVADLLADRSTCSSMMLPSSSRPAAGDVVEEVLEHLLAVLGVQHLGVELHAVEPRSTSSNAATGVRSVEPRREALGRRGDRVAVAHPDVDCSGAAGEQRAGLGDVERGAAVLASPVCATSPPSCLAISWKP